MRNMPKWHPVRSIGKYYLDLNREDQKGATAYARVAHTRPRWEILAVVDEIKEIAYGKNQVEWRDQPSTGEEGQGLV